MSKRNLDVRFVWRKPERGFDWKRQKGETGLYEPKLYWPHEKKGRIVMYSPAPGLFRVFADLKSDPKSAEYHILNFANDYGDILGRPGTEFLRSDSEGQRVVRPYAAISVWTHQIKQMQRAERLWDQCNNESLEESGRQKARKELQIKIETALKDMTTPSCATVRMNERLELFVYPVNLLAFMWLTLARLASGEIAERPCMGCARYIYTGVGPGLMKTGTTTCSPACRKRKERHARQENAQKALH